MPSFDDLAVLLVATANVDCSQDSRRAPFFVLLVVFDLASFMCVMPIVRSPFPLFTYRSLMRSSQLLHGATAG